MSFWARSTRSTEETPYARRAMAFVLCAGRGRRLMELTDWHAKPAVPFGGKWRIIDFALSNALNSGIRHVVGEDPVLDAKRFRRTTNSVTLITQQMLDRLAS